MISYSAGKWSRLRFHKLIAKRCENNTVIKVLRIKQKLKKMDLTSCVIDQSVIFSERFNWKEKASTDKCMLLDNVFS